MPFRPGFTTTTGSTICPKSSNLTSLEIAGRVALNRLGLMPERIRGDGYEVFVPDEALYDLERARLHIWATADAAGLRPTPVRLSEDGAGRARASRPCDWLEQRSHGCRKDRR